MNIPLRVHRVEKILMNEPAYRIRQAAAGLFQPGATSWDGVTALSAPLRAQLTAGVPWLAVAPVRVFTSRDKRTEKAVLTLTDNLRIETVLMKNARSARGTDSDGTGVRYTICVSSQVGCAMRCSFCATGKMGLFRNLTADEIVDQYRFWCGVLEARGENRGTITNIVFMGMGEPFMNYDAVREACTTLLTYTDIGPTRIVVSTVGVRHALERLLKDAAWPSVRIAVSLHSAIEKTRKRIVPTHAPGFLKFLLSWSAQYHKKFPERSRHLSFEYVLLSGINDDREHAEALADFAAQAGRVRINLIFWNPVAGTDFKRSIPAAAQIMQRLLKKRGIVCTIRDTQGQDIDAACGQLILKEKTTTQSEQGA